MAEKLLVEFSGKKNLQKYARILVSGNDLSDLTRFALSAPKSIWAAAYPNWTVLAQNTNTRYVEIKEVDDLLLLRNAIRDGLIEDVETVVFDRIDEIQRRMMLGRLISEKRDVFKNEDWNWMESKLNQIAKGFSDLEVNLVFIAGAKDVGGYDGQDLVTKPDIQGGFASDIFSYVDYAFWYQHGMSEKTQAAVIERFLENNPDVPSGSGINYDIKGDSLLTTPTVRYPWVFDATKTLREELEMREDVIQEIVQTRKTIKVEESQDPLEIVFAPISDPEEKDVSIPGMTKADKLNKILNNKEKNKGA